MGRGKKTLAPGDVKEDLILLPTPSDESILANIKDRYSRNQIFTRIGAGALVVVNPVKTLESFSDTTSAQYADWARDTSEDKVALPAHIFDLAASVFYHMLRNQQDQSVVFRCVCVCVCFASAYAGHAGVLFFANHTCCR